MMQLQRPGNAVVKPFLCWALLAGCVSAQDDIGEQPWKFDVHLHAYPLRMFERANKWDWGNHVPGKVARNEEELLSKTLGEMDKNEIRAGLLSGDNAMVQEWVGLHPERFVPSYTPNSQAENHLEQARLFELDVKAGKWKAMGEVQMHYSGLSLNAEWINPYLEVCLRHELPVLFHCGISPGNPYETFPRFRMRNAHPLLLEDVLARYPKLKVVICHVAVPFHETAIILAAQNEHVYLEVGAINWFLGKSHYQRILREAIGSCGADKILFGSDQMAWPHKISIAAAHTEEATTPDQQRAIFADNARRVFNLTEDFMPRQLGN